MPLSVQQNVAGLDVAVNNLRFKTLVQIGEPDNATKFWLQTYKTAQELMEWELINQLI